MQANHVHLLVSDLPNAVEWFERIWGAKVTLRRPRMAMLDFGSIQGILDLAPEDEPITMGFASQDCDADYRGLLARGAESSSAPADQPWGSRVAYLKGPGRITLELEQPLAQPNLSTRNPRSRD